MLANLDSLVRWGSAVSLIANILLASRSVRWLLERLFGLSRRRRLPTFATRTFLQVARRRGWTRKPHTQRPRLAYFADTFANYLDPQVAEATVLVLRHNGFDVYVPPGQ